MNTLIYTHEACFNHRPSPHHPESPERLEAVLQALRAPEFFLRPGRRAGHHSGTWASPAGGVRCHTQAAQ